MSEHADITWGEPPDKRAASRGSGKRQKFVEILKTRPGEWAKYPETLNMGAASSNQHQLPGTQWTSRKRPDGKYDAYARWIGDSGE